MRTTEKKKNILGHKILLTGQSRLCRLGHRNDGYSTQPVTEQNGPEESLSRHSRGLLSFHPQLSSARRSAGRDRFVQMGYRSVRAHSHGTATTPAPRRTTSKLGKFSLDRWRCDQSDRRLTAIIKKRSSVLGRQRSAGSNDPKEIGALRRRKTCIGSKRSCEWPIG